MDNLNFDNWGEFIPIIKKAIKTVATNSGENAIAYFGFEKANPEITNIVNEKAVAFSEDRSAELVGKKLIDGELVDNPDAKWAITDSTREMLRTNVQTAIEEGWSTKELSDALENNYAFSDARANTISRTEIANAHVQGQMISYRAAGVTKKTWVLGSESCDECQDNAKAGEIDIDDDFPSGDEAPPAHPNCTCDVLPIIEQIDNNDDNQEE
ncbi:MAG: phage minor head protein [Pseudomonadota bacterium]